MRVLLLPNNWVLKTQFEEDAYFAALVAAEELGVLHKFDSDMYGSGVRLLWMFRRRRADQRRASMMTKGDERRASEPRPDKREKTAGNVKVTTARAITVRRRHDRLTKPRRSSRLMK